MKGLYILPLIFIIFSTPAYAQINLGDGIDRMEEQLDSEESVLGVKGFINGIFENIGEFGMAQTNSTTWFNQEKKDQINDVTNAGVETGKTSVDLWLNFHELIVDAVFAGSPVPFDKGIIVLISFVLTTIVVVLMVWSFFKRTWKIALILIGFIAIVLVAGIQFPSI